jgi:hypothetical protein
VQSQLKAELDSAMIVFFDRFIVPDFHPDNQPAEKCSNISRFQASITVCEPF